MTVIELVTRERRRLGRVLALGGGAVTVAAVASILAIAALGLGGGRWMGLPRILPFIPWLVAVGGVASLAFLTRRLLARDASTVTVAAAIERERRLRAGTVRGAIEVSNAGALGRRGAKAIAARLSALVPRGGGALAPLQRRTAVHRATVSAAIAGIALATLGGAAVTQPDGWSAVLHPIRAWRGTLLPALRVTAPVDVPRGQEAHIRVTAPGRRRVAVNTRATGSAWNSAWYPTPNGYADITTPPVSAALAVVASDGRATSDTAVIRASDRPFMGNVALRAAYPAYLHRADETLPAGEVARVPKGTRIEIVGEASTNLAVVELVRGRDTVSLATAGRRFTGHLEAESSGQWSWHAAGPSGAPINVPSALELAVIPDSAPRVQILSPARDTVVTAGDRIPLVISASDDHALASVVLRSWRTEANVGDLSPVIQSVSDSAVAQWSGVATLDLAARGLQPGDAMRVMAEATDGSPWHQTSQSRVLVLRVPTVAEERVLARGAADSAAASASAAATAQRQLEQRTEEAARARGTRTGATTGSTTPAAPRSTLSYENAQRAKALAQEQRELTGRIEQLQRQTQQLERQLKQAGALDSGLSAQLHEAQQLLSTALTPELREQLSKLDQSADSLRGGDTRQSLADLAQQQQQLREQLERSVDVLKRAALEGAMATLRDEARDIAKQERAASPPSQSASTPTPSAASKQQLADNGRAAPDHQPAAASNDSAHHGQPTGKGDTPPGTQQAQPGTQQPQGQPAGPRQSQEQLAERSRELSRDVQQLAQKLALEKAQTGAQRVDAARNNVDSSTQALSQRNTSAASTQMSQAADQLGDARKAQIEEWKQKLTSDLDKSIQETMQMARQENELAQKAQQGKDKKEIQEQQSAVQQGAERTGERMQRASQQSGLVSGNSQRALGQARAQVQSATREAQQSPSGAPSGQQTANAMKAAADALNQAAAAMAHDRERAGSASSASGLAEMMQEMQQLAKAQGALNSQAQGLSTLPRIDGTGQRSESGCAGSR